MSLFYEDFTFIYRGLTIRHMGLYLTNDGYQIYRDYPLVICYIAIENGPVEIVSFPVRHGDFP